MEGCRGHTVKYVEETARTRRLGVVQHSQDELLLHFAQMKAVVLQRIDRS